MFPCVPAAPSPTADQKLAAVLRSLRKAKGATQETVAFNAGLTTRSLQKIEHGHTSPEWATVRRIANALDVGLVELAQAVEDLDRGR
jgi:transcriptional regulator with XRE-family HTH domain